MQQIVDKLNLYFQEAAERWAPFKEQRIDKI
jgi:hypothetical protein